MNKLFTFFRESYTARFLIPVGIVLIVFGVVMFNITAKTQDYIKTDATVSKMELVEKAHTDSDGNHVDATYKVYVHYTVDGKEYDVELGELSGYKENQKITIYYNPQNPEQITQTTSFVWPILITFGGIGAFTGGIISGLNAIKRHKKMKEQEKGWAHE